LDAPNEVITSYTFIGVTRKCKSHETNENRKLFAKEDMETVIIKSKLYRPISKHVDETGRTKNSPKSGGRGRGHHCHVAVKSPPLGGVEAKGQPGLQPHGEAQEATISTSAAPKQLKRARQ
jgi:hypothetical protein